MPDLEPGTAIHLGRLPAAFRRGSLLIGEVVLVPGVLLYALVTAGHAMLGILVVLAWRAGCIGARLAGGVRVPVTCWLAFGLFLARTAAGLAVASVGLYLVVPVLLCAAQGVFFLGSACTRRPVMMRLAADYAEGIPDRPELRRVFGQMSAIWGAAHVVSAALGAWALTLPNAQAVAVTSVLGLACAATSVLGCVGWGVWRAARIPGLRLVCADRPAHADHARLAPLPAAA